MSWLVISYFLLGSWWDAVRDRNLRIFTNVPSPGCDTCLQPIVLRRISTSETPFNYITIKSLLSSSWIQKTSFQSFSSYQDCANHMLHYYRPQRSCGQGYVFTRVCDSVHGGSPGSPPPPGPGRHPPRTRQTPPRPGIPPTPRDQGEPPPDQGETPHPDQGEPPPPGRRLQHTVNERPVRILLECILVG